MSFELGAYRGGSTPGTQLKVTYYLFLPKRGGFGPRRLIELASSLAF